MIEAIDRVGRVTTRTLAVLAGRPARLVSTPARGRPMSGPTSGTMQFIGVSTGGPSAMRLFPLWASRRQLDGAMLVGRDPPLDTGRARYRAAVGAIRDDRRCALVTTHKVGPGRGRRRPVRRAGPVRPGPPRGLLHRQARRPAGRLGQGPGRPATLGELLGPGYFAGTGGHVLCLGGGGAGTAIRPTC